MYDFTEYVQSAIDRALDCQYVVDGLPLLCESSDQYLVYGAFKHAYTCTKYTTKF